MSAVQKIQNHFGFSSLPFVKQIAVKDLFQSHSFKEALLRLELALDHEDMTLITGGVGAGKSNVLRYFIQHLDAHRYVPVYITVDRPRIGDIVKSILVALHQTVPFNTGAAIRLLKNAIAGLNIEKGIKPILFIDEAQSLTSEILLSLKNLVNYQMDSANYLLIVLCGQKEMVSRFRLVELESVQRRLRLAYELQPLALEETGKYILHHLKLAGLDRPLFTDDLIAQIFQHAKGVPGYINKLCYDLLLFAAAEKKDIIEPSMLEKIL